MGAVNPAGWADGAQALTIPSVSLRAEGSGLGAPQSVCQKTGFSPQESMTAALFADHLRTTCEEDNEP